MPEPLRHLPSLNHTGETLCERLRQGLVVSLNRIDCPDCLSKEQSMIEAKQKDLRAHVAHKAANATNIDEIVRKHAEHLQNVYDNKTAGDHTFIGVLTEFLNDLRDAPVSEPTQIEQQDENPEDKILLTVPDFTAEGEEVPWKIFTREGAIDYLVLAEKVRMSLGLKAYLLTPTEL